ncbi:MAG: hypothetical protein Fur0037_05690 [Planctomycetota bacterium]
MRTPETVLESLQSEEVEPWLPALSEWLLSGSPYGVEHTWPQLYRGDGRFLGVFEDGRLVSHLAWRHAELRSGERTLSAALLGSVATDPERRGRGLAGSLLAEAVERIRSEGADVVLLWAEREDLYARCGFESGQHEPCGLIARRPCAERVRVATSADVEAIHELHEAKPIAVRRTIDQTRRLLAIPGLVTTVLGGRGRLEAYACCGKGADLQGWWHECGGDDEAVARLLAGSMHLLGQTRSPLLIPPYRPGLAEALQESLVERFTVRGPMRLWFDPAQKTDLYVDGLDSV